MTTKREKGNQFQRWIKKWLEERGWTVRNFPPVAKAIYDKKKRRIIYISVNNDVWGADLVCRKIDSNRQARLLWIQCSLDSGIQKRLDEFEKYFKKLLDYGEEIQIWIKTEKGIINIKECWLAFNEIHSKDIGKIIRGKYYAEEGIKYEF